MSIFYRTDGKDLIKSFANVCVSETRYVPLHCGIFYCWYFAKVVFSIL